MKTHITSYLTYLEQERNYSSHTITAYKKDLEQFYTFLEKQNPAPEPTVKTITQIILRSYLALLLEGGMEKKSIRRKLSTLRSFFKYLLKKKKYYCQPNSKSLNPKSRKKTSAIFRYAISRKINGTSSS